MIPPHSAPRKPARWQTALAAAITQPSELIRVLELDRRLLPAAERAARLFPLRVPRVYVERMTPGDEQDPLLRQVLPLDAESEKAPGFATDAVGDLTSSMAPGVLHKYRGRVLLITTAACAIHCRFCFRRHFPYSEQTAARDQWNEAIRWIAANPEINEVILSGGDPLSLSDDKLAPLCRTLDEIPHVSRIRIHTRQPVVLPERVDDRLLAWVAGMRSHPVFVLHVNHDKEIGDQLRQACLRLRDAGAILFNQSVLLRGVNDNVETLARLSEALFECGVLPYYLHMLDRVEGVAHFEVDRDMARTLYAGLLARLPGYLVPRLVSEMEGEPSKLPVAPLRSC
jgi:EF-P beta-lysylation protein EpmB